MVTRKDIPQTVSEAGVFIAFVQMAGVTTTTKKFWRIWNSRADGPEKRLYWAQSAWFKTRKRVGLPSVYTPWSGEDFDFHTMRTFTVRLMGIMGFFQTPDELALVMKFYNNDNMNEYRSAGFNAPHMALVDGSVDLDLLTEESRQTMRGAYGRR